MSKDDVVQLWLDAEEKLRCDNEEKALELKEQFSEEFDKLSEEDQKYVKDELDSLAG